MASDSSLPREEQLLCSICLDVFAEPVSTPCGHNYCKTCITGYWDSSDLTQCPLCKKKFRNRLQLQVNTGFRDMVEHFNNMSVRASPVAPSEVTNLKKHQLTDPVSNLEERVCKKHDKMFELFCHVDQMCICFMCLKDDHATHEAVLLEHVFGERKAQLGDVISQAELIEFMQEKQKDALKQAKDHVTQLEQEVAELRRRKSEMEQLLQTEDHLRLLHSWPSLYIPVHTEDLFNPLSHSTPAFTLDLSDIRRQSYVVKKAVAQMENTLTNEIETLIHEVRFSDGCEAARQPAAAEKWMTDEFIKEVWDPPQDKLMMIQQCGV
ncbi:tripartite motif-containing protein 12A-like [Micropterus salmoides]|uniref:tripartite motif-containing protein 12A-like n=1 Tax=Micropterus salmoides TaxID=27706 RepID=UPI0018ED38B4|nr:tripartite motif-containing protein 12A-like [Micropterus salmoides]